MNEITISLHMHTPFSDGASTHRQIAEAAARAGLDAVIVTDHNVWVNGMEAYYQNGKKQVLLLVGEEVHDSSRSRQKNHLLVIGAERELSPFAADSQQLVDMARQSGGLTFLAHPYDPPAPLIGELDLSWTDWQVQGFTGIELWNGMSELKSHLKTFWHALYYIYNPRRVAHGPTPETLQRWDELLAQGRRVVGVGGPDAHAYNVRRGPLRRVVFPYEFHFHTINMHLLLSTPLTGELRQDRQLILEALGKGHGFIGYDLPAGTRGFSFTAQGKDESAWMGDEISGKAGVTIQIRLPRPAECRLIKDGKLVKTSSKRNLVTHITAEPGAYRVEVYLHYLGKRRGWIFSNPIYVRA